MTTRGAARAQLTPLTIAVTGSLFFGLLIFSQPLDPVLKSLSLTPLFAAVLVGGAQNVFSKGAKYSLFDPCKEMAYIPLEEEIRTKGKAAIDVICNPVGKSGGSAIQQARRRGLSPGRSGANRRPSAFSRRASHSAAAVRGVPLLRTAAPVMAAHRRDASPDRANNLLPPLTPRLPAALRLR